MHPVFQIKYEAFVILSYADNYEQTNKTKSKNECDFIKIYM